MSGKKQKQNRLEKKYTYPEFLKEFFPNINPDEGIEEEEEAITQEEFLNVLKKVTNTALTSHDFHKVGTRE